MNFTKNILSNFNLCSFKSSSNHDGAALAITIAIAIIVLIICIVIFFIKIGDWIDKKNNSQTQIEQPTQDNQTEKNETIINDNPTHVQAYQEAPIIKAPARSRHSFLFFFIKLILLVCIITFTLWNYRLFEINKGWSIVEINNNSSYSEVIDLITDIEKIEYFKVPHSCNDDNYKIHISTSTKSYLFNATENDINFLNHVNGIISTKLKPKSVTVIPFYVEIIVGLLIIFIPFGKKR